jgi:hypothetical protein
LGALRGAAPKAHWLLGQTCARAPSDDFEKGRRVNNVAAIAMRLKLPELTSLMVASPEVDRCAGRGIFGRPTSESLQGRKPRMMALRDILRLPTASASRVLINPLA